MDQSNTGQYLVAERPVWMVFLPHGAL